MNQHSIFMLIPLLMSLIIHAEAIHFNRTDFRSWNEIHLDGDAAVNSDGVLMLVDNRKTSSSSDSLGRAVFAEELIVWDRDNVGGRTVDFETTFSFSMTTLDSSKPAGDGFAFFLAKNGSHAPPDSWGGCLGLITHCDDAKSTGIVAVEFDSYLNQYDTNWSHIGINVNSIRSEKTVSLNHSWISGEKGLARVWYISSTKTLSVTLDYGNFTYELSHQFDLSKVLPERVNFGFSAATGFSTWAHDIHSWEFNSTEFPSPPTEDEEVDVAFVLACSVGGSFLVLDLCSFIALCYFRKKSNAKNQDHSVDEMDLEFEHESGPRRFSYGELVRATNEFSEQGKLGEGGFGEVYRGYLKELSLNVAVKRVSKRSKQGRKEYVSEVKIISKLRHKNLVQLIGWCHENGEFLLIYEFLPNRSLDSHLFGSQSETVLSWETRYKIVLGLANALFYLHEESEQCVLHRDIKSSNVMLDSNFNAKLGDFGLARLVDESAGQRTTGLAGTLGYMAPEYLSSGKASKASDVFSFGVVVLEMACGRKSVEHSFEEDRVSLVAWVWEFYGNGKLVDVIDRRLSNEFDVKQVEALLTVGLWCVYPDYTSRPSIKEVIQALGFEVQLPILPKKMPIPNYDSPFKSVQLSTSRPSISYSSINVGR